MSEGLLSSGPTKEMVQAGPWRGEGGDLRKAMHRMLTKAHPLQMRNTLVRVAEGKPTSKSSMSAKTGLPRATGFPFL